MPARDVAAVSADARPGSGSEEALLRCADEPIAIPGEVQPHGVLLAVTEPDLAVVVASAIAADLFGALVTDLAAVLDPAVVDRLRTGLAGDLAGVNPLRVQDGG